MKYNNLREKIDTATTVNAFQNFTVICTYIHYYNDIKTLPRRKYQYNGKNNCYESFDVHQGQNCIFVDKLKPT